MIIKQIYLIMFFLITLLSVNAQQLISTAKCDGTSDKGSFTSTIGEVIISEVSNNFYSLNQGFEQNEKQLFDSNLSILKNHHSINIYPNPFIDILNIIVNDEISTNCKLHIFDLNGKTILSETIQNKTNQLKLNHLPSSVYFFRISDGNQLIQTNKICKKL